MGPLDALSVAESLAGCVNRYQRSRSPRGCKQGCLIQLSPFSDGSSRTAFVEVLTTIERVRI